MSFSVLRRGVAPALLGAPPLEFGAAISDICASSACALHLDIMDGVYAGKISFGSDLARAAKTASTLPVQIHLQIHDPAATVGVYAGIGDLVIVHQEIDADPAALVTAIHDAGCTAGIALAPDTGVEAVYKLLPILDAILVMTSPPGTSDYQERTLSKLTELASIRQKEKRDYLIIADGGITNDNAAAIWAAGADQLAAASAVFRHPDGVSAGVQALERRMNDH
jgi:ribulose-phosphate 3-epimerase